MKDRVKTMLEFGLWEKTHSRKLGNYDELNILAAQGNTALLIRQITQTVRLGNNLPFYIKRDVDDYRSLPLMGLHQPDAGGILCIPADKMVRSFQILLDSSKKGDML